MDLLSAIPLIVALRKESVDRNVEEYLNAGSLDRSLSARRAWIEIWKRYLWYGGHCVALRKESVDRNVSNPISKFCNVVSLSARRAWIEIDATKRHVDQSARRSPQGERG